MRYARKLGLAGVPGAILEQGDIRRAASFFAEEDRKAAGSVALGSLPSMSSEAACATCSPTGGAAPRLSDRIASKMFREMGAIPLAEAATNGKESPLMARAGALAAGLAESLKLRTDKIAVLSSLTSPMFAKAIDRTTLKLHGLKGNDRFASALTLGFLMGATDDHAKRPTFYADAYRKAVQGMTDALAAVSDPALRPMAQKVIATLGMTARQQTPRQLAGLGGPIQWGVSNTAPLDTMVSSGIISRSDADTYGRISNNVSSWRLDPSITDVRDTGTATRSPSSLKVVDTQAAIINLWQMLVHPVQTTVNVWEKTQKRFGNNKTLAVQAAKKAADEILKSQSQNIAQSNGALTASWIIKNYADRINNYSNSGIGKDDWDKYNGITFGLDGLPEYGYEKNTGFDIVFFGRAAVYSWGLAQGDDDRTKFGLYGTRDEGKKYNGVASRQFFRHCMIAYYAGIWQTKQHLLDYLSRSTTQFPVVVGYALALARRDALERTGQIGNYGGEDNFEWIPNPDGVEQLPQGTEGYADWFTDTGPMENKVRPDAIKLVTETYKNFYKKEPTVHAIGWYGRMGYGIGKKWYDLAPDDIAEFKNAITGAATQYVTSTFNKTTTNKVIYRTPEEVRIVGSELPPSAAKDRSSWFAVVGDTVGGILSSVLSVMSGGLEAATNLLCKIFKWLFGESAGGVICSIIGAIVKFMVGAVMGATAALFAIVKGISLFINDLMKGETIKAFKVLLLGVNQAIFFVIGGPFAAIVGGNDMPFLKSQEKELRDKAKAAGLDPNDVLPSLESLAEAMTNENPFFIFDVIFSVIDIATSVGALLLKASGRLVYALCPVMGYVFAGKAMKAIKESTDPEVNQWKKLTIEQVRAAITAIVKIFAAVVMGILAFSQAIRMLKEPWKRYIARKGGGGKAIWSATKMVAGKIDGELVLFFPLLYGAAKNGFQKSDPVFQMLKTVLESMWKKVPQIILGFVMDEFLSKEDRELLQPAIDAIKDSVEDAKKAYNELKDTLFPSTEYDPVEDPLPKDPEKRKDELKKREGGSKALLPLFALAAGLVVGFIISGDSDGA